MRKAFRNMYDPIFCYVSFSILADSTNKNDDKTLPPVDSEFRKKWLEMWEYEYYQNHKEAIDKYGTVFPSIRLSSDEIEDLKAFLEMKHNERKKQI